MFYISPLSIRSFKHRTAEDHMSKNNTETVTLRCITNSQIKNTASCFEKTSRLCFSPNTFQKYMNSPQHWLHFGIYWNTPFFTFDVFHRHAACFPARWPPSSPWPWVSWAVGPAAHLLMVKLNHGTMSNCKHKAERWCHAIHSTSYGLNRGFISVQQVFIRD